MINKRFLYILQYYIEPKLAKELEPPLCITLDIDPSFSSYVLLGFYFDRDFARSVPDSSSVSPSTTVNWSYFEFS